MSNQNGWLGISQDKRIFTINTSNVGAAGGWSVLVVKVPDIGPTVDLTSAMKVVERDFSSRHDCATRGDNYEALQWRSDTRLLISASVYGTSDCGAEMGYTEGYLLDVVGGKIMARYSEPQMLDLPCLCPFNVWQPGDPNP